MSPELVSWLQVLLLPILGVQVRILVNLAKLGAVQGEHERRLNRLELVQK